HRQLLIGHLETAIADHGDYHLIAKHQLRTYGGRHAVTHRTEATAGNPLPRPLERIKLRRPHLVLPNVGGDQRVSVRQTVQLSNHSLRLNVISRACETQRLLQLPCAYTFPPGRAWQ